ncbi:hypothetical protein SCHPADRAFT_909323 [Schizopora paradoxa]|uniref:Uncharacterized protein n=1 Tax=Schizopora paradoxa TaxID=27342 RepID=A0A0H2RS11_9AGAM|nr:hypothetical protein SCHPADRAFT_909323 [Schizopora paradoxa]
MKWQVTPVLEIYRQNLFGDFEAMEICLRGWLRYQGKCYGKSNREYITHPLSPRQTFAPPAFNLHRQVPSAVRKHRTNSSS